MLRTPPTADLQPDGSAQHRGAPVYGGAVPPIQGMWVGARAGELLRAPPAGAPGEMGRSGCVPLPYLVALPLSGLISGDLLPFVAVSEAQARSPAPAPSP